MPTKPIAEVNGSTPGSYIVAGLNFERDVKTVCTDILDELEIGHEKVFQRYREAMDDVKQVTVALNSYARHVPNIVRRMDPEVERRRFHHAGMHFYLGKGDCCRKIRWHVAAECECGSGQAANEVPLFGGYRRGKMRQPLDNQLIIDILFHLLIFRSQGGQADHVLLHLGRGLEAAKTVAKGAEAMVQTGCLWRVSLFFPSQNVPHARRHVQVAVQRPQLHPAPIAETRGAHLRQIDPV